MRDAGHPVREVGNPPELWLAALPLYAELQRAECAFAADHVDRLGAPDLLLVRSADRSSDLVERELAVEEDAQTRLAGHLPDVERLCADLATSGVPESIQHDDLHMSNLYVDGSRLRVLDWGDSSVSHPFASLVVTFRFLREYNRLSADDPWFAGLCDA